MPTKTFSGRADATRLSYADALTRDKFGMSFGQYCGSVLVDAVYEGAELPVCREDPAVLKERREAWQRMQELSSAFKDSEVAHMSDDEIKELIASRYA